MAFGLAVVYVLVALGLTLIFSILEVIKLRPRRVLHAGRVRAYYLFAVGGLNYFARSCWP